MTADQKNRLIAQVLSVLITAGLGACIAVAQGFLQSHGYACEVHTDPALAASAAAGLRGTHMAINLANENAA